MVPHINRNEDACYAIFTTPPYKGPQTVKRSVVSNSGKGVPKRWGGMSPSDVDASSFKNYQLGILSWRPRNNSFLRCMKYKPTQETREELPT